MPIAYIYIINHASFNPIELLMKTKQLFFFFGITLFGILSSCSKDDDPVIKKPIPDPEIMSIIQNIKEDSLQKYVMELESMGTRFALAPNRRDVAMFIKQKFEHFGYSATLDSFEISVYYGGALNVTWQYNVVATMDGTVYPDSISIIGGHHDCTVRASSGDPMVSSPGANDNASGVATTLEVARVLKLAGVEPTNTIKFITFAAEELGLFGSKDYARKAYSAHKKIKMMLNNDMVAFWSLPDTSNWTVNIIDYPNSYLLRTSAEQVCKTYTSLKTVTDNTYQNYSDSYPFHLNGFEAIFFISDADDPNYHTPMDLTTACNFKFCREVAKVNCVLLLQNNFEL